VAGMPWTKLWMRTAVALACITVLLPLARAQHWERLGPEGGQVLAMAKGPDGTVYLGMPDGHVFASVDRGESWEIRGRVSARLDAVIQALIVDERDANSLFAGVWYMDPSAGGGVFRSDDAGRTWKPAGLAGEAVRVLQQSPSEPNFWIAGTRSGIFRTRNGGARWERISPANDEELKNIDAIALDPKEGGTIYAGTYHLLWKTMDGGVSWAPIHAGMIDDSDVMSLRVDRENPIRLFASACSGIYRSEDQGSSWTKLQGIPYSSRRTQQILQDPADPKTLYAATTEGLWMSHDVGENWTRVTPRDWTINSIVVLAGKEGSRILLGTEGRGVQASDDGGKSFFSKSRGFAHQVIASLARDPGEPRHLAIVLDGRPQTLLESRDGGKNWTLLPGRLPAGGMEEIFGGALGWWAALRGGGVARYEAKAGLWRMMKFLTRPARLAATKGASSRTAPLRSGPLPAVRKVVESFGVAYVVTTEGVWSGDARGNLLRPFERQRLRGPARDFLSRGATCAVLAERILCRREEGAWEGLPPIPKAGEPLWVASVGEGSQSRFFVGTSQGVFTTDQLAAGNWHLVQSGLPAAGSSGLVQSGTLLGISMSNGGFYVSADRGASWGRQDTPKQTSILRDVVADGDSGFVMASATEGVLRWAAQSGTSSR
jgi:photosystem II stability/assembly factor-like uncharacterized protein